MMSKQRLIDVFPNWNNGGGIFAKLQTLQVPWQEDNIAAYLDLEYYGNRSGDKTISPLIQKIKAGTTLTDTEIALLANTIAAINGANWGKLWATLELTYNPIQNYDMTETMTDDETVTEYGRVHTREDNLTHAKTGTETDTPNTTETRTDNLTHAKTGTEAYVTDNTETRTDNLTDGTTKTDTTTHNTTETNTPNITNETDRDVYGFNSSTATGDNETTSTTTGTDTTTKTGTDTVGTSGTETHTGTQTTDTDKEETTTYNTRETETGTQQSVKTGTEQTTYNTQDRDTGTVTDRDSGEDTHIRNYELHRSGNIGVTTSQQMIQSERDLWKWNFFYDVVFPDIDKALTLCIY